jgi:hypothetical protein
MLTFESPGIMYVRVASWLSRVWLCVCVCVLQLSKQGTQNI